MPAEKPCFTELLFRDTQLLRLVGMIEARVCAFVSISFTSGGYHEQSLLHTHSLAL